MNRLLKALPTAVVSDYGACLEKWCRLMIAQIAIYIATYMSTQ
jgi:hypothetical protein